MTFAHVNFVTTPLLPAPCWRAETAPCPYPSITQKPKGIELRNFQNPYRNQFCTCSSNKNFTSMIARPWLMSDVRVTSCSANLGKRLRDCGNRCHTLILCDYCTVLYCTVLYCTTVLLLLLSKLLFSDKDNRKTVVYSEKKWLPNWYLG